MLEDQIQQLISVQIVGMEKEFLEQLRLVMKDLQIQLEQQEVVTRIA